MGGCGMNRKQKKMLLRIIIAAVLLIGVHVVSLPVLPRTLLFLAAYLVVGYDIL